MSERQAKLESRYQAASAQYDAAHVKRMEASESRLHALMQLSPAQRIRQIDDPVLTPSDREHLKRSLIANSFLRAPRKRWPLNLRWRPSFMQIMLLIVLVAPTGAALLRAWENTAGVMTLPNDVVLEWQFPDGNRQPAALRAGQSIIYTLEGDNEIVIRSWIPFEGYATILAEYS